MDIDVTQRLIKESIICLCRNHFCIENEEDMKFEIDGIICISFDGKKSDKYTVFKIHEWITNNKKSNSSVAHKKNDGGSNIVSSNTVNSSFDKPRLNDSVARRGIPSSQNQPQDKSSKVSSVNGASLTPISSRKRKSSSPRHQSQLGVTSVPSVESIKSRSDLSRSSDENQEITSDTDELGERCVLVRQIEDESVWSEAECSNLRQDNYSAADKFIDNSVTNDSEGIGDSLAFSCAHCDVVCITQIGIKGHINDSHGTNCSWICTPCRIGFSSEEIYSNHCRLHGCKPSESNLDASADNSSRPNTKGNVIEKKLIDNFDEIAQNSYAYDSTNRSKENYAQKCRKIEPTNHLVGGMNSAKNIELRIEPDEGGSDFNQEETRVCSVCFEQFKDFPSFNVHATEVHSSYPCPYCDKMFTLQTEREMHLFEHTGESPLECSVCGLNCVSVELLEEHKVKLHGQIPETVSSYTPGRASYKRVESAAAWPSASSRSSNLFYLTPSIEISDEDDELSDQTNNSATVAPPDPFQMFKCDVCGEVIAGFDVYSDHCALAHRRIPCPYCGGTFSQKASMERHQRLHTGIKPFRCTLCPLSFTRKEPLRTHLSRTHNINDFYIL